MTPLALHDIQAHNSMSATGTGTSTTLQQRLRRRRSILHVVLIAPIVVSQCGRETMAFAPRNVAVPPQWTPKESSSSYNGALIAKRRDTRQFSSPSPVPYDVLWKQATRQSLLGDAIKPAAGHSQPIFGPSDPYLAAGKSVAPTAKALSDMGITVVPGQGGLATTTATMSSWPELAQRAVQDGVPVLDQKALVREAILPGFTPTASILPSHSLNVPLETPATFAASIKWAASFLNVVDMLPIAVLVYALVEFFILRPNLDVYKEDIESNPRAVWADTVAVSSVRLVMFAVVAALTTVVFG